MSASRNRVRSAIVAALAMVAAVLAAAAAPVAAQEPTAMCMGRAATIVGDGGTIVGTAGDDVIVGTEGNERILGKGGDDYICALGGRDRVLGGSGDDVLNGGRNRDTLRGGIGRDTLVGDQGRDTLFGGDGPDRLFGGVGWDDMNGGRGNDRLFGGGGNDLVNGSFGRRDFVSGGSGEDTCLDRQATTIFVACEAGDIPPDFELTILHINDHHSHLNSDSGDLDFNGVSTRVRQGGFPSVVSKFDELAAAHEGDNIAKVHAGDAVTGTLFYSLFKGEADAAMMNEICFDVFELGNHEFDDSDAGLAQFLGWLNGGECQTAVLGANVVPAVGTPLLPDANSPLIAPFEIIEYGDDSVGFIGLDIANKTKNSSSPLETTQFLDEVETAQANIDLLTAEGIDKIVLVTHIQYDNDLELASMVTGVDVIVGGDSHTLLGDFADLGLNSSGPYPTHTTDAAGAPVCVVQAWQYSWLVGELNVGWDADGDVVECDGTPHLLLEDSFQRRPAPGEDRVEIEGADRQEVLDIIAATPELTIGTPDAAAQAILDEFDAQVSVLEQTVIGTVTEDLCLERIPGQGRSTICDVSATAMNGGDIQQLVTEAFRVRSFESDIAIQNSGGVRIDIPMGDLTIADAFELLPFANTIVNLEMTGAEIKQVLEDAVAFAIEPDGSTGAYPYASGLTFHVDLTANEGNRVTNLMVRPLGARSFVPLDPQANYTVATNSFVAGGGDRYTTFAEVVADGRSVDTFLDYAQSFIDYVQQDRGGIIGKLPVSEYSTQSFTPLPAP